MNFSINKKELLDYTLNQINNLFKDNVKYQKNKIVNSFELSLKRLEFCFSKVNNKYFFVDGEVYFNHLHGDQYSMFLYIFSNTLYQNNIYITLCEKLFLLNKMLFGIDVFYEIKLPNIFLFVHPLGTVIGRGKFNDYLVVYQGCSIGANKDVYPTLGKHVTLHPNASILGDCKIGNNCELASNSLIIDKDLDSETCYFGNPKNSYKKKNKYINNIWNV
tara:strand:- start:274 stop:927 length:654 start_codon:yes stop_codon:yes gene_type:complete